MKEGLQNMEILIVDRDDNLRSALKLLLMNDHVNINITEAGNMESALRVMDATKFNLAIVDWNLHRNSARDLITKYRARQPNIIIIVLSMRIEDKAAALEVGTDAFVYKGDPPEQLHNTLLTYLAKASERLGKRASVLPSCPRPICCHYLI